MTPTLRRGYFRNLNFGVGLLVPFFLSIPRLGMIFENYFLFFSPLFQNLGLNFSAFDQWRSDFYFVAVGHQQNLIKMNNRPFRGVEFLYAEFLARGYAVLLTPSLDNRKHTARC